MAIDYPVIKTRVSPKEVTKGFVFIKIRFTNKFGQRLVSDIQHILVYKVCCKPKSGGA